MRYVSFLTISLFDSFFDLGSARKKSLCKFEDLPTLESGVWSCENKETSFKHRTVCNVNSLAEYEEKIGEQTCRGRKFCKHGVWKGKVFCPKDCAGTPKQPKFGGKWKCETESRDSCFLTVFEGFRCNDDVQCNTKRGNWRGRTKCTRIGLDESEQKSEIEDYSESDDIFARSFTFDDPHFENPPAPTKTCSCPNGIPATGTKCLSEGYNKCEKCNPGHDFGMNCWTCIPGFKQLTNGLLGFGDCVPNECKCTGGTPQTGVKCIHEGWEWCETCDDNSINLKVDVVDGELVENSLTVVGVPTEVSYGVCKSRDMIEKNECDQHMYFDRAGAFIETLNYPRLYANGLECEWRVNATSLTGLTDSTENKNQLIVLEFDDFDVEYGYDCEHDRFEVRNAKGQVLNSKLCGSFYDKFIGFHEDLLSFITMLK